MPLLVRIDRPSGAIEGPYPVERPEGSWDASDLVVHDDLVWIRWATAVTRYDPLTGESHSSEVPGVDLISSDVGLWTRSGYEVVTRLDDTSGETLRLPRETHVATAEGRRLWFASREFEDQAPYQAIVQGFDPATGNSTEAVAVAGGPQRLEADPSAVWLTVWRESTGGLEEWIVQIDPTTCEVRSEVRNDWIGAFAVIVGGELWLDPSDRYGSKPSERRLLRIDASTGALISEIALDGSLEWPVAGGDAVWGCTPGFVESTDPAVAEIGLADESLVRYEVPEVDLTGHLPPPPRAIEVAEAEQWALDKATEFMNFANDNPEITFVSVGVELESEFPQTHVVVRFLDPPESSEPQEERWPIWASDGQFIADPTMWALELDGHI